MFLWLTAYHITLYNISFYGSQCIISHSIISVFMAHGVSYRNEVSDLLEYVLLAQQFRPLAV